MATLEFFFGRAEGEVAEVPPSRFHCILDEQPSYLVPANYEPCDESRVELMVNPQCWFSWDGAAPQEVTWFLPYLNGFYFGLDTVWVADPVVRGLMPFWLGPQFRAFLQPLRPGDMVPASLSSEVCAILRCAEVFVDREHFDRRAADWAGRSIAMREQFRARGYTMVSGLLHPFHVGALRRYYRYLIRSGGMKLGDAQCPGRYVAHNEIVARFFHYQLAAAIGEAVGEFVKPSYVYVAAYQSGAELPKHTDREQCEYSLTLCIDHSPPELEGSWPIHLESSGETTSLSQRVGDGIVYRGRELAHYREMLPAGSTAIFLLFHYVPEDFSGSLD